MVHGMRAEKADSGDFYPETVTSLLTEPNGGMLVNRMIDPDAPIDFEALPEIHLPVTDLMDVEQLAVGTYSPLDGFMELGDSRGCLTSNRTPAGVCWTLPVILQIGEDRGISLSVIRLLLKLRTA